MSLGRFCANPRQGHLEHLKRVIGYMKKQLNCDIQFCTAIPDHKATFGSDPIQYDWMETVYGTPPEEVDQKAPYQKVRWCALLCLLMLT